MDLERLRWSRFRIGAVGANGTYALALFRHAPLLSFISLNQV
jgi:hypothetical protein